MSASDHVAQVAGMYEAFGAGDMDKVFEFSESLTWENYEDNPFRGQYEGREGIARLLSFIDESVEMTRFDVEKILADEDTAVAVLTIGYTVKETGRHTEGPTVHIYDFKGDRAVRVREVAAGDGGAWRA